MNDEELDELLRGLAPPQGPQELAPPRPVPRAELVVFAVVSLAYLAWVFGTLVQIFGA